MKTLKDIKLIIFDWSGVISDDRHPVYLSNMQMLESRRIRTLNFKEWLKASKMNAVELLYSQGATGNPNAIYKEYKQSLNAIIQTGITPKIYLGAKQMLKSLKAKGYVISVVSHHPRINLEREIRNYGLQDCFSVIIGNLKNKPKSIQEICQKAQIPLRNTAYIGDTIYDIKIAKIAGVRSVGVTWGYHDKARLLMEKPDVVVDKMTNLAKSFGAEMSYVEHDVYFAAPLFSESEKRFNKGLTQEIEALGLSVFLPQRDGLEFAAVKNLSSKEKARRIYNLDVRKVEEVNVITAVLDGRVPDEGVVTEVAMASEYRKLTETRKTILGLKTDTRTLLPGADLNPLIAGNFDVIFNNRESLISHIKTIAPSLHS